MSKCSIERINNGFIFREVDQETEKEEGNVIVFEDGPITTQTVYSTTSFEEEIVPLQKLFYTIMDYFGVYNNKHERKAIDISIVNRNDFPVEDTIEELRKENESLKCENLTLYNSKNKLSNEKRIITHKDLNICWEEPGEE